MGSNLEATRLSGVNTRLYMTLLFVVCGGLAGLGGVMETARTTIGQPTGGELYELDSIAAAVIGGASLNGGQGSVAGTLIGAFIMAVLRNGCNLCHSASWQAFHGAIIHPCSSMTTCDAAADRENLAPSRSRPSIHGSVVGAATLKGVLHASLLYPCLRSPFS